MGSGGKEPFLVKPEVVSVTAVMINITFTYSKVLANIIPTEWKRDKRQMV